MAVGRTRGSNLVLEMHRDRQWVAHFIYVFGILKITEVKPPPKLSDAFEKCSVILHSSNDEKTLCVNQEMKDFNTRMYPEAGVRSPLGLWLRFVLCFFLPGIVTALISKGCITFEEHLIGDIGSTLLCKHHPGRGSYGECKVSDFQTDLSKIGPGIRSLCIESYATVIPANVFSHLPTLEFLQINGYDIAKVHSGAFSGLRNLRHLRIRFNASSCNTVMLDPHVFAGLDHLEELDLTGFRLDIIPNTTFDHLLGLVGLYLVDICTQELSEVFCLLPNGMSRLTNLTVVNYGIVTVSNRSCAWSKPWPSAVLAGIQNLEIHGEHITTIDADSLVAFQNLSRLTFGGLYKVWLGKIWESGVGKVSSLDLFGNIAWKYSTSFKDLCRLICNLDIQNLCVSNTLLDTLSKEILKDCGPKLKMLSISMSYIQHLEPGFWKSTANLESFHLFYMKQNEASFCEPGNWTMWNITTLNLKKNLLTAIKARQFVCAPLLEQLLLNNNEIETVEGEAFSGLPNLKILDISSNKIKILAANDFQFLGALEVLLIENNVIEILEDGVFRNLKKLRELTIGKLNYVYVVNLNMLFYGFPEEMQHLSIDAGDGTYLLLGNVGRPKGSLVFELKGTVLNVDTKESSFYEAVREIKLVGKSFYEKTEFFVPRFSNLESLDLSGSLEIVNIDYTKINTLLYLKRLKLANVNFSNRTNPAVTFWNLKRLQILVLYNCRLNFLTREMFRDLHSLELLRLFTDNPLMLHDGMFDKMPLLSIFVLEQVDFCCDCSNGWFLDWAQSTSVQVINLQKQQCIWHYQKRNFLSTMEKLCQTDVQYLCYLGTAITVSVLLSASISYRFAYWPCMVLFFRLRGYVERTFGKRWWKRRPRVRQRAVEIIEDEDMKYDAFVSFSSRDEAWVLEEMAPRLEEQGHPRLRLCLHNRDFEVGKGIVDNIAESIYSSRRTVCVLSRQYLRSDWCSLEMRMATYRLLEEEKHRLILVFLEHISPFELSAFHRLAKLVKSRTYLDWPRDESERIHFWERLRRNIADGETDAP